jgi:hypothetical protein
VFLGGGGEDVQGTKNLREIWNHGFGQVLIRLVLVRPTLMVGPRGVHYFCFFGGTNGRIGCNQKATSSRAASCFRTLYWWFFFFSACARSGRLKT